MRQGVRHSQDASISFTKFISETHHAARRKLDAKHATVSPRRQYKSARSTCSSAGELTCSYHANDVIYNEKLNKEGETTVTIVSIDSQPDEYASNLMQSDWSMEAHMHKSSATT